MNTLMIAGSGVRQDSMGRYCLNDCHKASGGDPNKRPGEWTRTAQAAELINEIAYEPGSAGNPAYPISFIVTGPNDRRGTYVAKELVYAYAMWISPAFHLTVIRAFDALVTGQPQPPVPAIPQTYAAALLEAGRLALENEALTVASQKQQAEITRLTPKADICEEAIRPEGGHDLRTFLTSIGPVNVPETFRWLERRKMIHRPTSKLDTGWLVTRNNMTEGRGA